MLKTNSTFNISFILELVKYKIQNVGHNFIHLGLTRCCYKAMRSKSFRFYFIIIRKTFLVIGRSTKPKTFQNNYQSDSPLKGHSYDLSSTLCFLFMLVIKL